MSILTASNPLILALVLSLYHVAKRSYRILKLKKILISSTIGGFTLHVMTVICEQGGEVLHDRHHTSPPCSQITVITCRVKYRMIE